MEEWKEYKLEQGCENIYSGGTPSTMNKEYWNGDFPWLSSGEIGQKYIYSTEKTITQKGIDNSSTCYAFTDSTVVASAGQGYTRGQASYLKINTYVNQSVIVLKPNPNIIDSRFLYFNIDNRYDELRQLSDGTSTRGSLSGKIMKDLSIKLPPLPTQQKIAAILSSLDDKIELNNKINTNLEQQAQALFDERFKDDEKDILLGEVIETTSGGTPSRKNMAFYTNGNNCWVKSKELESGFIIDTEEKITDDAINNSAAKLLLENSVLIAMYGATVGAYGIISKPMNCNQAICVLLPNENYPYTYLFMFAKNVIQELENLAVGSAQQNISQVIIKKLKVHSDTNKIKEFHSSSNSLFEQMLLIKQENKILSELRDSLLPKLMNGEIGTNSNIISKE